MVKHEIVSESDARKIAKKFKTPLEKFPRILETDPQAVKIKAKPGQLVAIYRTYPTEHVYYRYVARGV